MSAPGSPEGTDAQFEVTETVPVCATEGHAYVVVVNAANDPTRILCTTCGKQAHVEWPAT